MSSPGSFLRLRRGGFPGRALARPKVAASATGRKPRGTGVTIEMRDTSPTGLGTDAMVPIPPEEQPITAFYHCIPPRQRGQECSPLIEADRISSMYRPVAQHGGIDADIGLIVLGRRP